MRTLKLITGSVAILLTVVSGSTAQTWDTLWTQTYWDGWFDSLNWMAETSDNGFILAGLNRAEGQLDGDVYLVKTDCLGVEEWSQVIGDDHYENGYHVLQTSDGGYLISAGSDLTGSAGVGGIWIIRTDASGDTLWTFPWCPDDRAAIPYYAIETAGGGYAITGVINLADGNTNQAFILVLNGDGTFADWAAYGEYGYNNGYYLTQMEDGGFIFTGAYDDVYGSGYDWWTVRTSAGLGVVWDSIYVLSDYYDEMHATCRTGDGLVMVGLNNGVGHVMKINFEGQTQWSKEMSLQPYDERWNAVCTTEDGGYMVGGWHWVTGARRNFTFIRLDNVGDTLWTYQVGGPQDDHGQAIVQTFDGNFALAGPSNSWVAGQSMWLVKIGLPCCEGRVGDANGEGGDEPTIGDVAYIIDALFISSNTCILPCFAESDVNQSGGAEPTGADVTIGDAAYLIDYLFITGPSLGLPDCL